jgi:2',3'-cyclic-nucleotide 2'-phosphodiesterase
MKPLKLLFVGDVVGETGVETVERILPHVLNAKGIDFCVVNGENAHEGRGTNEALFKRLIKAGADVVSGGDHSFDKHLIFPFMAKESRLLRPYNYPKGVPGFGYCIATSTTIDVPIAVLNMRGLSYFQNPIRCPFMMADEFLKSLRTDVQIVFVDFHAEATAEKTAFAYYLDGRVSAIGGTHTHVQTADERVFPAGTGYITDVGFTGPHHSVIGMDIDTALQRFMTQMPQKFKVAEAGMQLDGAIFHINLDPEHPRTPYGKTLKIERIQVRPDDLATLEE